MVCEIIWSPKAIATYIQILKYLETEWTRKEVNNFITRVEGKLQTLQMQPKIGNQTSKNPAVFRTLVHKKITVVYKYKPLKKEIELITFWNNQQDPKKLKF